METVYRRGTQEDIRAVYDVLMRTLGDLQQRQGTPDSFFLDPNVIAYLWHHWGGLWSYLAEAAEEFWVAEANGQVVGFSRTLLQDGVCELTEFFVLPEFQSNGVGRELLARSFPSTAAMRNVIIATTDVRALVRYLKCGVYPRFPIHRFEGAPQEVHVESDLVITPMHASPETLTTLRDMDKRVLHFARDADHAFLLQDRQGYLYHRDGQAVGYGYIGRGVGPVALLHETDYPAVLAHAESQLAHAGADDMSVNVPMINRAAIDHLLARGFHLDGMITYFMSNEPFGAFENYIFTSPPVFL